MTSQKLKLLDSTEKKIDPRVHLVSLFNKKYEEVTGKKNPFTWGMAMNAMLHFEPMDKKTGECYEEYPDEDTWNEQLNGFFKDEFARDNRGYHFTYFLKQFGSFVKVFKKSEQARKVNIMILCEECGKQRQPFGVCEHCGK
jgi:hypothetical protein